MNNNKKIIHILLILTAIMMIIGGTFAWLKYRINDARIVFYAGDIDSMYITVKPYQIRGTLDLANNYLSNNAKVIDVEVTNNGSTAGTFNLYFDISEIDQALNESEYFKWKVTKSIDDGLTYQEIEDTEGDFTGANTSDNFVIYSEEVLANTNNPSYKYKVYIWLQSDNIDQTNLASKVFNANFEASVGQSLPIGTSWDFNYNGTDGTDGSVQEFIVPVAGTYKLETWGAQGASYEIDNNVYNGGYGGYSTGTINLNSGDIISVAIGGQPDSNTSKGVSDCKSYGGCEKITGGYNGGGNGYRRNDCIFEAGGGATHMVINSNLGELRNYSSVTNQSDILIVSGGGGGGGYYSSTRYGIGGSAGGSVGVNGRYATNSNCESYGYGGTQSAGGNYYILSGHAYASVLNIPASGFGYGGDADANVGGQGGGGGWYGGRGTSCIGGGGGGSGYIGNSNLTTKSMYCYGCTEDLTNSNTFTVSTTGTSTYKDTTNCPNGYSINPISKCAKSGHGYARITFMGKTSGGSDGGNSYLDVSNYLISIVGTGGLYQDSNGDYRYDGTSPTNYVTFNGETWRIVGVFNTKSTVNGTGTMRVKLVRDAILGTNAYGSNNTWSGSTLQTSLNNTYGAGSTWLGSSLNETARSYIGDAVWYYGSIDNDITPANTYTAEMSGTTWVGKVGIINATDYAFASSSCRSTTTMLSSYDSCISSNWLYISNTTQWTMTQRLTTTDTQIHVQDTGRVSGRTVNNTFGVRPAVYLNADVKLTGGSGTSGSPYTLGMSSN